MKSSTIVKAYHILYIAALLFGICSMSWLVLRTPRTTAQSAGASVTVAAACSFTGTVNPAHTASIPAGTYKDNIGETVFNAVCNDSYGYSIYAIGYSNNEYGNNKLLATIGGVLTPAGDIVTGTATSGNTSNWAMKMIPVTGTSTPVVENGYGDYNVIPATATKVASFPSATDMITGSSIKATYAANISSSQPAGNYDGKVKFIMVHPATDTPLEPITCDAGKICYAPNARGVADSMGDQDAKTLDFQAFITDCASADGSIGGRGIATLTCTSNSDGSQIDIAYKYLAGEVELWASNFRRDGYGFAGWKDESGNLYGPNQVIDTALTTKGLALYANWVQSAGNLQNWSGCSSMSNGQVTALTDTRDNNTYAVAKLADGNCWMIENMRLGSSSATTLTPTDSNVISNFTLSASTNPTTTAWCADWDATCMDQSMLNSDNTTNSVANMTTPDANVYGYGNYYNWYSATAGTGTYSMESGNALSSICPIGWRLPAYTNQNADFYKLASTISGKTLDFTSNNRYTDADAETVRSALQAYPNNFIVSAGVNGSFFVFRGVFGEYWSASASNSDGAHDLGYYYGEVGPGTLNVSKSNGLAVRCMAAPPATISDAYAKAGKTKQNGYYKMQDMDDNICGMANVLDEPGQTQLIDTRDNKVYWATKLKDGKCWMTQNLDHNISTTFAYTPDNTDIPANWTPDKSTYPTSTTTWDRAETGNSIQQSYDPGDKIWDGIIDPSGTTTLDTMTQGANLHYHIGNYYNFGAAVAMNDTSSYATRYQDVNQSICPKGWTLPKSGNIDNAGSFKFLIERYGFANDLMTNPNPWLAPLYFTLGGLWFGSSRTVADDGRFWSPTIYSSTDAYYLRENYDETVSPIYRYARLNGLSVRCVNR